MSNNYYEERPWGSFEHLLDEEYCKVKRIIVKPKQRLSYQYHNKRSECWTIVKGEGIITIDGIEKTMIKGESVKIELGVKHRIHNSSEKQKTNTN